MDSGRWKSPDMIMIYCARQLARCGAVARLLHGQAGPCPPSRAAPRTSSPRSSRPGRSVQHLPMGGMLCPAAHIFAYDEGVAFADLGWDDPNTIGQHSMHVVEGKAGGATGAGRAGSSTWDGQARRPRSCHSTRERAERLHLPGMGRWIRGRASWRGAIAANYAPASAPSSPRPLLCLLSSGSSSQSQVKIARSSRPISLSARCSAFWRGKAASFFHPPAWPWRATARRP